MLIARPSVSVRPAHVGLAITAGVLLVATIGPLDDTDAYWHVELGREVLGRSTLQPQGGWWLGVPAHSWATTQWAAEAAMAALVDIGGWQALALARTLAAAAILTGFVAALLHHRSATIALIVFALTGVGLVTHLQDRPQTISLGVLVWLSWVCCRAWTIGDAPRWRTVAATCLVWAQFHGLWIVAPAAFLVTAAGLAIDRRRRLAELPDPPVRGCLLAALAASAGLANPRGLTSLTAPLDFRGADAVLAEWGQSTLFEVGAFGCAVALGLVVMGWAAGRGRVPAAEVLWVAAWGGSATLAYRNALAALVPISLAAAASLERGWGARLCRAERSVSRRESRILASLVAISLPLAAIVAGARLATTDPLAATTVRPIAASLARSDRPLRVFNAYNVAGELVAFGGGKVRLVVDGRFDLWGSDYVGAIIRAEFLGEGWERTVEDFRPDAFVLPRTAPLVTLLLREGRWRVTQTSHNWALLEPSGSGAGGGPTLGR